MPALISQIDANERYLFANSAYKTWFGLEEASAAGMTVREFMGESVYQMAKPMIERALAGEMVSFENELQTQQGLLMIHTTLVPCEAQGFYILAMDITELKRLQQRLEYDATHDMLTGLTDAHFCAGYRARCRPVATSDRWRCCSSILMVSRP